MEHWELVIRERVRDTVSRYAHAADSGRAVLVAECFAAQGVLTVGDHTRVEGRDGVRRLLEAAARRPRADAQPFFLRHLVVDLLFTSLTAERVELRSYFAVLTPAGLDHWGRYLDVVVPEGDRWVFLSRAARIDGRVTGSWLDGRSAQAAAPADPLLTPPSSGGTRA